MSNLRDWIAVSENEQPYIHFESSLDDDQVVAGYVPVKSTLDVLSFLKDATATHASQGRAVICYGSYGSGKSRLCSVLARLFRDGFDCPALKPVWHKLEARGEGSRIDSLRQTMVPGGESWRPWLVVTAYAGGAGGTFSTCLIRALFHAVKRAGLEESVLGTTVYHAAASRLNEMIDNGAEYKPPAGSPYATVDQLRRALEEDYADDALNTFRTFYRTATFGTEFDDWVRHSGGISLEAHDVFNTVAERIQRHGYEGIVVIWDEFGFFIEELLRGSEQGTRSLGREAMSLQNFIERSCSNTQLGRKVVFLGFTHVSLTEYGSRQGLGDADSDRLSTVSDRFRDPSIPIKLSVTENEGYHLLAGMIHRTDAGRQLFANPIPKLQQIASKMPEYGLWARLSDASCYDEIIAPCYPLHPCTSAALLLLSDQVAQRARTTFYYLQNRQNHGLAGQLEEREAPDDDNIGGTELIRVNDLFSFFEEAIQESKRHLFDQYEEAIGRFPDATPFHVAVLRTALILSVIASREMAPTTSFLSLCLCDSFESELAAHSLNEALRRLTDAAALWKNEATDVWGFVGTQGLTTGLAKDLEEEKELVPANMGSARLLRHYRDIQREIIDLIGDFDLDPAPTGIVRRVGIGLLDIGCGEREKALDRVNPVNENADVAWRSALVYLVATDTDAELAPWRQAAQTIEAENAYFVIPPGPISLDREHVRELIAAHNLLEKTDSGTHTYEVLEGKLTRLRSELSAEFRKSFGNDGLRLGTVVMRCGHGDTTVPVSSWSELLPAIADDLNGYFSAQIRVRCGTFNEWKTGQSFSAIETIVARLLRFDENPDWHTQFLGFKDTSQHAAIVDGVLIENRLLKEEPLSEKWLLEKIGADCPIEALQEVLRFFQTGGGRDKEVAKLFSKLINAPFGIPNGILPLLVALVVRTEGSRIAVYSGPQNQRVSDSQLAKAIADMARHPSRYRTRYNKLSNKQRIVFCAVGPELGVPFPDRVLRGEAFYEQCERVRAEVRNWLLRFPEMVLSFSELTEQQRRLTRLLRLPVPPQLPVLADCLVEFFTEEEEAASELAAADAKTKDFPAMAKHWRQYRTAIERYVDGARAPLRAAIREASGLETADTDEAPRAIAAVLRDASSQFGDDCPLFRSAQKLGETPESTDPLEAVAAAVSGKSTDSLTEEDFGKAVGVLEVASAIRVAEIGRREREEFEVIEPDGKRTRLVRFQHDDASAWLSAKLRELASQFLLTDEHTRAIAVAAICSAEIIAPTDGPERGSQGDVDLEMADGDITQPAPTSGKTNDAHQQ